MKTLIIIGDSSGLSMKDLERLHAEHEVVLCCTLRNFTHRNIAATPGLGYLMNDVQKVMDDMLTEDVKIAKRHEPFMFDNRPQQSKKRRKVFNQKTKFFHNN